MTTQAEIQTKRLDGSGNVDETHTLFKKTAEGRRGETGILTSANLSRDHGSSTRLRIIDPDLL